MITNFRQIIEEKTGDTLEHRFGKASEIIIQEFLKEKEDSITTPEFVEAVGSKYYLNPEVVGLVTLICPPLATFVTNTVFSKTSGILYRIVLWFWYLSAIINIITGAASKQELILYGVCLVTISFCFRKFTKEYNLICLVAAISKYEKKGDRVSS